MVRETRVGIVVSCSFLCLVGVVLASKLREQGSSEPRVGSAQEHASLDATREDKKLVSPVASTRSVPAVLPPAIKEETEELLRADYKKKSVDPPRAPEPTPPPVIMPAIPPLESPLPPKEKPREEKPGPVAAASPPPPTVPSPVEVDVRPPVPGMVEDKAKPPAATMAPPGFPDPIPDRKPEPVAAPLSTPPGMKPEAPAVPPVKEPDPVETPGGRAMPIAVPAPPPPAAELSGKEKPVPVAPPSSPVEPPGLPVVPSKPRGKPAETAMPPVAIAIEPPVKAPEPPAEEIIPVTPPMTVPGAGAVAVPPVKEPAPKPPEKLVPAVTPIVARTPEARLGAPVVDSFAEEEYKARAGDTFAAISKLKYGSEAYAEALRQYNRNDALQGAPAVEKDGSVKAGSVISIPETRVLEKRYGAHVPGLQPLPGMSEESSPPADKKLTPIPAPAPAPAPVAIAPKTVAYTVPASGQTMREIARLTLGNGDRQSEIQRLNPGLESARVLPGGTALQLPADARP